MLGFKDKLALNNREITAQRMKFSIKDFFSKRDQIRSFQQIWSHLLKKILMENSNFYAVIESLHLRLGFRRLTIADYFLHLMCLASTLSYNHVLFDETKHLLKLFDIHYADTTKEPYIFISPRNLYRNRN